VHFLYNAKNILIKRNKTKLEHGLPIPHIKNFSSEEKKNIIEFIKVLTSCLMKSQFSNQNKYVERTIKKLLRLRYFSSLENDQFQSRLIKAAENHNKGLIQMRLDTLFFQLFDLDENKIDYLLKKYYSSL